MLHLGVDFVFGVSIFFIYAQEKRCCSVVAVGAMRNENHLAGDFSWFCYPYSVSQNAHR